MTTRRGFILEMCAAVLLRSLRDFSKRDFRDIRVDRLYTIGKEVVPGAEFGSELIEEMDFRERCRDLEDWLDHMDRKNPRVEVHGYLDPGGECRRFGDLRLTKKWLLEFRERHRGETKDDWERRQSGYFKRLVKMETNENEE